MPAGPGRPKGSVNKATVEHKAFLTSILDSQEYREALRARVVRGDPTAETLMHHYALGKPKDTVSIENAPPLLIVDVLTPADLLVARQARDDGQ